MRSCSFCSKDITGSHLNRKYCSNTCYEKHRYKRDGIRGTPEQRSEWYAKRVSCDKYRDKINEQGRKRAEKVRAFLAKYKLTAGCSDCGYNKHHVALDFDHVVGTKNLNVCHAKSIRQAKSEIKKCEVVCSNCHRIRTFKRIYPCKPDIFEASYEEVE